MEGWPLEDTYPIGSYCPICGMTPPWHWRGCPNSREARMALDLLADRRDRVSYDNGGED